MKSVFIIVFSASCSDNSIYITRPASLFTANTLNLRGSSTLTWSLSPGDVFEHPLIDITQNAAFSADTLIEVDLGKFTGRATLFQSSTGDLSDDAVNVSQNAGYDYNLIVNPNLLEVSSWITSIFIVR
ncbi:MAG: hypothetical protein GX804_10455 [Lentisphaerae bacterium]|jgi:hypothetical protein|nr:hypothetical protein [Lentisphaerota bacterium]